MSDVSNPKDLGLQGVAEKMDERLDDETEIAISLLIGAVKNCAEGYVPWDSIQSAENYLRKRIRTLVSGARQEATVANRKGIR